MCKKNAKFWLLFVLYIVFTLYVVDAYSQSYFKGPALIEGLTSTVTAAGTTTLTKDSQTNQRFTGTTTQTLVLPNATTLPVNRYFVVENRSTGIVTVNTNGGALLTTIPANSQKTLIAVDISTAAGVWDVSNINVSGVSGILPIANGGTNSGAALSNGRIMTSLGGAIVEQAALTINSPVRSNGTGYLTTGNLNLATEVTGLLGVANGGTGLNGSTAANGNLLIGNGTGYSLAPLTGTTNQVNVTNGSGSITLSLPQSIATTSSPTFSSLTLTNPLGVASGGTGSSSFTAGSIPYSNGTILTQNNANLFWDNTNTRLGIGTNTPSYSVDIMGTLRSMNERIESTTPQVFYIETTGPVDEKVWVRSLSGGDFADFLVNDAFNIQTPWQYVSRNAATVDTVAFPNGKVGIGTFFATTSAKLEIAGTDGALLLPRLNTTQRNALTPTAGMQIYNTTTTQFECYVASWGPCGGGRVVSSSTSLGAGATLTINLTVYNETQLVAGSSAAVTLSTTPFGSTDPVNGYRITLIGNSDTNTVSVPVNDAANGVIGYQVNLGRGQTATWEYNSSLDRYVYIGTSN